MDRKSDFQRGFWSGLPIGLGYLSVSFAFGIMAVSYGFQWWEAVVISITNLTSAGQFAGISLMTAPGYYLSMLLSQLTINVRYSFMSVSLSQKLSERFKGWLRWFFAYFITDEIFAVAVAEEEVTPKFFAGLTILPYIGWGLGTFLGAILGNVLPVDVMNALSMALYSMFIAIVIPEMKANRPVLFVVCLAVFLSCLFYYVPILKGVSSGIRISVCAILTAAAGAVLFPRAETETE